MTKHLLIVTILPVALCVRHSVINLFSTKNVIYPDHGNQEEQLFQVGWTWREVGRAFEKKINKTLTDMNYDVYSLAALLAFLNLLAFLAYHSFIVYVLKTYPYPPVTFPHGVDLFPECPVCYEYLTPPLQIYSCENGHLVCQECKPKISKCILCRGTLVGRATAMEQLLVKLDSVFKKQKI